MVSPPEASQLISPRANLLRPLPYSAFAIVPPRTETGGYALVSCAVLCGEELQVADLVGEAVFEGFLGVQPPVFSARVSEDRAPAEIGAAGEDRKQPVVDLLDEFRLVL